MLKAFLLSLFLSSLLYLHLAISPILLGQDAPYTNYLVRYGQVWGFLKYFHPAPGETNWDQRLFDDFEKVKRCGSEADFENSCVLRTLRR